MNIFDEFSLRQQAKKDGITHLSTGVAILRDNKVLIARRAANDFLAGVYELPGGGVDSGETITEAAIREVKEETGLTVSRVVTTFEGFDYTTDKKPHVRQFNFLVEAEPGEVVLSPEEHDDFVWIDATNFSDVPMSANMRRCVEIALQFASKRHLYLMTLEVDRLVVGKVYNPLPSHLTLISRFWSDCDPDKIAEAVKPIVNQAKPMELIFGDEAVIGPKKTAVYLVEHTIGLKELHRQLLKVLHDLNVAFITPQFVGEGHKPHISKRDEVRFLAGHKKVARAAYLIEVEILGNEHLRNVRHKFMLGN